MLNQQGSITIWISLALLFLLVSVGSYWYFGQSEFDQQLNNPTEQPEASPVPEVSPDLSAAQQQYNLDEKQLEILSRVKNDGNL